MNEIQQRIKIAVACGWKKLTYKEAQAFDHTIVKFAGWDDPETSAVWLSPDLEVFSYQNYCLPNYLNDLNAIHEAEKILSASQWDMYRKNLSREWMTNDDAGMWAAINATAAQRCEAFLKTLNLWEE